MSSRLENYKTVLIIGNGFDLSLKYPTSYSDFMESQYFTDLLSKKDNALAQYLKYKKEVANWIDVEKELASYSNVLESAPSTTLYLLKFYNGSRDYTSIMESFRAEFEELCNALKEYLKDLENAGYFYKGFEHSPAYNLIRTISDEREPCYVVNFNYTVFAGKVIHSLPNHINFQIRQIHGSLGKDIVFGVQDNIDLKREHVFLYKSYNRCQDVRGLPKILENAYKIIFFGYSLGETDHSYFDDFFKNQTKNNCHSKNFVFYYYGQKAYDDLIWQLRTLTNNRISYLNQYNSIKFEDVSKSEK